MANAVIYCRKSTEDRTKQIQSLEDQERECLKVAGTYHLNLVTPPFKESKTAKKPGIRSAFYSMLHALQSGVADSIVVWDASRLARNAKDGGEIVDLVDRMGLKIYTPYTVFDTTNSFLLLVEFGMSTDYIKKLSYGVKRGLKSKTEKGW
jgi:DNA invertase Pin-like site-specific DNA recombinase